MPAPAFAGVNSSGHPYIVLVWIPAYAGMTVRLTWTAMKKIKDYSLYLVITEKYGKGRSAIEIADAAIAGGVDIIQMREKDKPRPELIELGKELSSLCKDNGVIFMVNDCPETAKESGADGVHLGQDDIKECSVEKARSLLGRDKIIGLSTHSIETFKKACLEDVDYIAYGPVFPTKIKENCIGTEDIGNIIKMTKKPVFFIGGINLENVDQLLNKKVKNISLIRAITQANDVKSAVESFKAKMEIASARHLQWRDSQWRLIKRIIYGKLTRTRQDKPGIF